MTAPALNETLIQEWTALEMQWRVARGASPQLADEIGAEVDALLAARADPQMQGAAGWRALNRAQQLVGLCLTDGQIESGFRALLACAKSRGLEVHGAEFAEATPAERRTAYLSLLHDVQAGYVAKRFSRRLSGRIAKRLAWIGNGLALAMGAALVPLVWGQGAYSLILVASFGVLGAYFSRVMRFQSAVQARSISFDDYLETYIKHPLNLRLLYGMIGALVFYLVMRGGMVSGSLFPDFADGVGAADDQARLLVWSFIAGFSERLVPDFLEQAEGQITS